MISLQRLIFIREGYKNSGAQVRYKMNTSPLWLLSIALSSVVTCRWDGKIILHREPACNGIWNCCPVTGWEAVGKAEIQEIPLKHKNFFYCEGDRILEWVAQRVQGVVVESPSLEKPTEQGTAQRALIDPALSKGLELQKCLPSSTVLCICEIGGLLSHLFITYFSFCPFFLKNTLTVTF